MAELDPGTLSAAIAGMGVYVSLLPHLSDVRQAATDSATARDVRTGVCMASIALVGTGMVISFSEGNAKPLVMTTALAVLMGGIYLWTLHAEGESSTSSGWGA